MRILTFISLMVLNLWSARLKDMGRLDGLEEIHLVGYGLVVGLAGTGDGPQSSFTVQTTVNMLRNMGIEVPDEKIRLRNVAAVMVTSKLEPFHKKGGKIDVSLSSMGDARSLEGGTLLMTPLIAEDQEIYAVAQGAISVGGMSASTPRGKASYRQNQTLSGQIPNGGLIKREWGTSLDLTRGEFLWSLNEPDFSSAQAVVVALQRNFGDSVAMAQDPATIKIQLPSEFESNPIAFIAALENVEFNPSTTAKVILNEKTGTVVAGADVRLSEVAVSHGNISIEIQAADSVSQPNPLTLGTTQSVISEQLKVDGPKSSDMKVLPAITNVGELSTALNSMGVAPRDVISIFQAIKKAGALHADLVIM